MSALDAMPADLAELVLEHGGERLPWESVDVPKMFSWRVKVRQYLVEAIPWSDCPAWTLRATHLENRTDGDSTFVKGEHWRDHALAALFAEMSQPDPRLAHLPDDLRAIAAEFLDLHSAWGTEFEASPWLSDSLEIQWKDREEHSVARFEWYAKSYAFAGAGSAWNVLGREFRPGTYDEVEGVRINSHGPLRRSADFAAFVQRFRGVKA